MRSLHQSYRRAGACLLPCAALLAALISGCQEGTRERAETAAAPAAPPASASFDHSLFDRILQTHVKDGLVDYASLKAEDEANLDGYLQSLADARGFAGPDDELAFWLNVYNASVIKGILDRYPNLKSVMDVEGFFDDKRWMAAGRLRSLNEIENEIIRPRFEDPRIHFILVCAAQSCPPLQNRAMEGATLQSQFESATASAVNSPEYVQIDQETKTLRMTRILSWYRDDFIRKYGTLETFVVRYREEPGKSQLKQGGYRYEFMDYDWALNDVGGSPTP